MRKPIYKASFLIAACITVLAAGGCSGGAGQPETQASGSVNETTLAAQNTESTTETQKNEEENAAVSQKPETAHEATDAMYLKTWFDVTVTEDTLKTPGFQQELSKVAGESAVQVEGELTWLSAVKAAVISADYEELALGYPDAKIEERLAYHGIEDKTDDAYAGYLACALDVSLITPGEGKAAVAGDTLSTGDVEKLLMAVADANGDARNYLGMSSDSDIYGKIDQAWNSFIIFDDGQLSEVGREAVTRQITTGYGIKSAAYDARFLPDLTLQYGHSDIKHAHQLIGLLNSENIETKVQLEPKVSIYQYLPEWGTPQEKTPTYEVKQFGDLYLVYAVEYDMQLEFNNTEDMLRFDSVIKDYAKKNEGNEEAVGMIYQSWWQPLYSTTRTDMPEADYHEIYDCVVENGVYSIHPFALPENKDKVVEQLHELAGDLSITPVKRYCNTAFYNYMTGEDYQ